MQVAPRLGDGVQRILASRLHSRLLSRLSGFFLGHFLYCLLIATRGLCLGLSGGFHILLRSALDNSSADRTGGARNALQGASEGSKRVRCAACRTNTFYTHFGSFCYALLQRLFNGIGNAPRSFRALTARQAVRTEFDVAAVTDEAFALAPRQTLSRQQSRSGSHIQAAAIVVTVTIRNGTRGGAVDRRSRRIRA
jgi:LSD1 subclass zinc finger protein